MPAYFTVQISDLLVMISTVSGVSTLLIGALLVMFGLGAWFRPTTATYLGVLGIIVAVNRASHLQSGRLSYRLIARHRWWRADLGLGA